MKVNKNKIHSIKKQGEFFIVDIEKSGNGINGAEKKTLVVYIPFQKNLLYNIDVFKISHYIVKFIVIPGNRVS